MLSHNDVPEVRRLYVWAQIEPLGATYRIRDAGGRIGKELLITNFEPIARSEEKQTAA
jgi:hypothetical protein